MAQAQSSDLIPGLDPCNVASILSRGGLPKQSCVLSPHIAKDLSAALLSLVLSAQQGTCTVVTQQPAVPLCFPSSDKQVTKLYFQEP